jgi:hypothetical protein
MSNQPPVQPPKPGENQPPAQQPPLVPPVKAPEHHQAHAQHAPAKKEPARVTIINQRQGKLVLRDKSEVPSGGSAEVSAEESVSLLAHRGVVDAAKLAPSLGNELARLKRELAEEKAKNAVLEKAAKK